MESTLKEIRNGDSVLDMIDKCGVGGGVADVYGEDKATEDQFVTPWNFSVASGNSLLRDPRYNKGLAFTEAKRDALYLHGLLPPCVSSQELQTLRNYAVPLQRYMAMMDLQKVPLNQRAIAAVSLYQEANCRLKEPVHGWVGDITY